MIFISIQPDRKYFLWQLELLIYNLTGLGLDGGNIQILFGYENEINPDAVAFAKEHSNINIYFYEDTRINKGYPSSLRPHIMAKHLEQFPELTHEVLFYHDADLLFRELPDIDYLSIGSTWYVADTRSYLGYQYLKKYMTDGEIRSMAEMIGIPIETVKQNDDNVGTLFHISV